MVEPMFQYISINKKDRLLAFAILMAGGLIYLLYRPQNMLLFHLTDNLGLNPFIDFLRERSTNFLLPSFVINSLPAGLWTASYLILMYSNTKYQKRTTRLLLSLPLPLSAIVFEFMQLYSLFPGTFDIYDLICYVIPLAIYIKLI